MHGYLVDDPDPTPRVLTVGSRLLSAAAVFFFSGFVFAFVYLKTLNSNDAWNRGLDVSKVFASVVLAAVVLSAVAYGVGVRRLRRDGASVWLGPATVSFVLGLVVIALHVWQLDTLPFTPTDGGYASVFVGWSVALIAVEVGAMYWLSTVIKGAATAGGDVGLYYEGPSPLTTHVVASARGYWLFWRVVLLMEVIAFILLVLVR